MVSRIVLVVCAGLLLISIFVPIWQIELDAPQYPEGLALKIWANKIAGDVEIINGLNHYIGMKTLHTEDFIEFTVLPFIIVAYVLLFLLAAIKGTRSWLYITFIVFFLFGIIAMADFWLWEYNYGHHLDPNAAIKVPGMAYQPPLIGFKQLLNFGAYSMPHMGGWLFVVAGILVLAMVVKEAGMLQRFRRHKKSMAAICLLLAFSSCHRSGPQPLQLNVDGCDFCRMTISDGRFGAELVTRKGRVYKFDDLSCLIKFKHDLEKAEVKMYYVHDYTGDNQLIDASAAWYVQDDALRSPMGGNTAAFADRKDADVFAGTKQTVVKWADISSKEQKHDASHH